MMIRSAVLSSSLLIAAGAVLPAFAETPAAVPEAAPAKAKAAVPWAIGSFQGSFRLFDGKSASDLPLKSLGRKAVEKGEQLEYAAGEVQAVLTFRETERGWYTLEVELKNTGDKEQWLEPILDVAYGAGEYEWFDGKIVQKKAGAREDIVGTLPLSVIYHGDRGIALGLDPTELVSHFRSGVSEENGAVRMEYASRVVLDPKGSEKRQFVLFDFKPEFGYRNAVALYHKHYPTVFKRREGTHPYLSGPSNGGLLWRMVHDNYLPKNDRYYVTQAMEVNRWGGGGWDWCYIGFGIRPGDWLCTEDLTGDWMIPNPPKGQRITRDNYKEFPKIAYRKKYQRSASDLWKVHSDAYERLAEFRSAPNLYIIPSYCEEELAVKLYPDSIYYNAQGKTVGSGPEWVSPYDHSVNMYSYGNSFGKYTFSAVEKIVERTPIKGFAFDCIDRARYRYTGPGKEVSPGRAWDQELGVYVNVETAHALFGRHVYDLKRDGYRMALTGNSRGSSGSYLSSGVMDAGIIEHSPWDERPEPASLRLMMGDKSLTFLHGYASLPNVSKVDGEKLLNMIYRLEDYSILQCLHHAIYPAALAVMGSPRMINHSRLFTRLFQDYGWQVVPGARGDGKLWITRYGAGEGGILFVGQAQAGKVEAPVEVLAPYFDSRSVVFVDERDAEPLANEIHGERTLLPTGIDRGNYRLYAASLHAAAPFTGKATASRSRDAGVGLKDTIVLSGEGASAWKPAVIPGYRLIGATIDGKPSSTGLEAIAIPPDGKEHQIVLGYRCDTGITGVADLAKLELLKEGKPTFTIVTGKDDADTRFNIARIASFFTKLDAKTHLVDIPVVTKGETLPEGTLLFLGTADDLTGTALEGGDKAFPKGEVRVKGNLIAAVGDDAASQEAAVDLLLNTLSDRYPNYGYLNVGEGSLHASYPRLIPGLFQKKTNLEYLPWRK